LKKEGAITAWIGVLKFEEEFPTTKKIYCSFHEKATNSQVMSLQRGPPTPPLQNSESKNKSFLHAQRFI